MNSPIFQEVPQPKRRIVPGTHRTRESSAKLCVHEVEANCIKVEFTNNDGTAWITASCCREIAAVLIDAADILEGK